MLFHPASDLLWDTWLVEHEGLFYLFYIRLPATGRVDPAELTLGVGWDAINLATSPDLLHWTEQGTVLGKHPDALWLGTGMIHRAGGRFVMNFSEERPRGHQVICFAASDDLRHWDRLPDCDLRPDGRLYQDDPARSADPLPRWDSIGVIPPDRAGDPYLGVLAADQQDPPLAGQCGVLGLVSSADGRHWTPEPPAAPPGLFPSYEVAEHVALGGRHYVLFSTNTTAGARFVPGDPSPQGGTYYVVADDVRGPYRRPPGHPLLHGHRISGREFGTYVGRPFVTGSGELLFYHHWTAGGPDGWWGPPKRLVEREPWLLGLDYWPGCEALKEPGTATGLTSAALAPLRPAGVQPVVTWTVTDPGAGAGAVTAAEPADARAGDLAAGPAGPGADLVVRHAGGAHAARWRESRPPDEAGAADQRTAGRIVETGVRIDDGRGLGLWVRYRDSESMFVASLNAQSQQLELGTITWIKDGSSVNLAVEELVDCPVPAGVTSSLRLLVRHSFAEIYLDDRLVRSFACRAELDPADLGFYCDVADGVFTAPRRWLMTI